MKDWIKDLAELGACPEALTWCERFDSLDEAWQVCERGDWMLWLAGKVSGARSSPEHRRVVLAACACARSVLQCIPAGEERPRQAIELAERWAKGEDIGFNKLRAAAYAAYTAYATTAYAAATAYAADAAYAAYYAAATPYAAYAAYAVYYAAGQKQIAHIIRTFYPHPPARSRAMMGSDKR